MLAICLRFWKWSLRQRLMCRRCPGGALGVITSGRVREAGLGRGRSWLWWGWRRELWSLFVPEEFSYLEAWGQGLSPASPLTDHVDMGCPQEEGMTWGMASLSWRASLERDSAGSLGLWVKGGHSCSSSILGFFIRPRVPFTRNADGLNGSR